MSEFFGVSRNASSSNVPNTVSAMDFKLQDSITKEPARSKTRGRWDCEAGGELTDHTSNGSTVSRGSIDHQSGKWVCDEDDGKEGDL
jgi:hypothetical protein